VNDARDLAAAGRAIIDANLYMVLGTADETGQPWAAPVYFAPDGYTEFLWVSEPEATHSRNIAARPQIGIVIFDSQVPINTGQGVYMTATAEQLTGPEAEQPLAAYSRRGVQHGGRAFGPEDIEAPAHLRLYRATASAQWVLDEHDNRVAVAL